MIDEIKKLSVPERIQLVTEIWESIAAVPEDVPVSDAQREELRRRVQAYRDNPSDGVPWEEVKSRMRQP